MALGAVSLKLTLSDQEFKSGLKKATDKVASTVNQMKTILVAAQLGRFLFDGAAQQAREELMQVQTALSAMSQGFTKDMIENLQPIIDQIDFLGVGADRAANSLYKFIITGRAMGLQEMGIYLDRDTQRMLSAASAADRYRWAIANLPKEIGKVQNALSPTTKAFYEFQKRADDVKKALGTAFMGVIVGIVDALGGLSNAMTAAIIAFTAYKTAMILGNVAIGISKAIAVGTVFAAPVAIGMGVAALAAIGVLIGGAALAVNAINNIPSPSTTTPSPSQSTQSEDKTIVIVKDRFGDVQREVSSSNGGGFSSIQTSYGS